MSNETIQLNRLSRPLWTQCALKHRREVQQWSIPFRRRRNAAKSHPVQDFLFVYYRYSSKKLECWHPGVGQILEKAKPSDIFPENRYTVTDSGLFCDPAKINDKEHERLRWTANLLDRTQQARPNFSCLGLHEWAMVYRGHEVRHEATTRLRLSQDEIDAVVESRPLTCTHFDAFRFYAIDAQPLNKFQPTMDARPEMEQPACIHANMDLYKWAFKSMPWIGSDLLFRCFNLAMFAREIDMRASPYDLSEYGDYSPILIETAEGRLEYEKMQREIARRAAPLRNELMNKIRKVVVSCDSIRSRSR